MCTTNPSLSRGTGAAFPPFLDRTAAAQRHEKPVEGTAGIIPGDRGMDRGSWCRHPLRRGQPRAAGTITSSSGRCHDRSSDMNSGAERQDPKKKPRSSRVRLAGSFDPRADAVTQRVMAATAQTRTQSHLPAGQPPPKGPVRTSDGARKGGAAAGRERARQGP